jgi:hypothetical protein
MERGVEASWPEMYEGRFVISLLLCLRAIMSYSEEHACLAGQRSQTHHDFTMRSARDGDFLLFLL